MKILNFLCHVWGKTIHESEARTGVQVTCIEGWRCGRKFAGWENENTKGLSIHKIASILNSMLPTNDSYTHTQTHMYTHTSVLSQLLIKFYFKRILCVKDIDISPLSCRYAFYSLLCVYWFCYGFYFFKFFTMSWKISPFFVTFPIISRQRNSFL